MNPNTPANLVTGHEHGLGLTSVNQNGEMVYVNRLYLEAANIEETQLLHSPHSMMHQPEMPRCMMKLIWDTVQSKREIFTYVVNRSENGDYFWVLSHLRPSLDDGGNVIGCNSELRIPSRRVLDHVIIPFYKVLLDEEGRNGDTREGMHSAYNMLLNMLANRGLTYDEFMFSLHVEEA